MCGEAGARQPLPLKILLLRLFIGYGPAFVLADQGEKGLLRLTARMRLHDHGVGIPSVLESLSSRASLPRMARAFRIKRQSCARTASRAASEAVAKSFYTFAFCTADLLRSCCSVIHPFPACHRNQNHVKWRHQTSEQNTLVAHCRH